MRALPLFALALLGCAADATQPATPQQRPVEVVAVDLTPAPLPSPARAVASAEPSANAVADEPPAETEDEESEAGDAKQAGVLAALQGIDGDTAFGAFTGDGMSGVEGLGVVGGLGGVGSTSGGVGWGTLGTGGKARLGGSAPTLKTGAPQSVGALPPEIIRRIVRAHLGELRHCYEKALLKSPKLEGKIGVRFVIGKDGAVSAATSQGTTMQSHETVQCVLGVFRAMSFPQPQGGIVTVNYPLVFQPSDVASPAPVPSVPAPKKAP